MNNAEKGIPIWSVASCEDSAGNEEQLISGGSHLLDILLMIFLCIVPRTGRRQIAELLSVRAFALDGLHGKFFLLVIGVPYCRLVLHFACAWIVRLEKLVQQLWVGYLVWIELDPNGLCVTVPTTNRFIGWPGGISSSVSNPSLLHAMQLVKTGLRVPESAESKGCNLQTLASLIVF